MNTIVDSIIAFFSSIFISIFIFISGNIGMVVFFSILIFFALLFFFVKYLMSKALDTKTESKVDEEITEKNVEPVKPKKGRSQSSKILRDLFPAFALFVAILLLFLYAKHCQNRNLINIIAREKANRQIVPVCSVQKHRRHEQQTGILTLYMPGGKILEARVEMVRNDNDVMEFSIKKFDAHLWWDKRNGGPNDFGRWNRSVPEKESGRWRVEKVNEKLYVGKMYDDKDRTGSFAKMELRLS